MVNFEKLREKKENEKMENKNYEVMNVDTETGEIMAGEQVVTETNDYRIVRLEDGTFKKNMKYKEFFSRQAETEEEKIELYKVFNDSDSGIVTAMRNMIDNEITIAHVFIQPYDSFDEKTGKLTSGVVTTLEDVDGEYYVTSSKTVYYTLQNIFSTFGNPQDENYKPVKVKVLGRKQQNGIQIDLELIGLA